MKYIWDIFETYYIIPLEAKRLHAPRLNIFNYSSSHFNMSESRQIYFCLNRRYRNRLRRSGCLFIQPGRLPGTIVSNVYSKRLIWRSVPWSDRIGSELFGRNNQRWIYVEGKGWGFSSEGLHPDCEAWGWRHRVVGRSAGKALQKQMASRGRRIILVFQRDNGHKHNLQSGSL